MQAQSNGYLYGNQCKENFRFKLAKKFLNRFVSDDQLSLPDSCFYLNNYNHAEKRGGHRYARPSYAAKFLIKKNMKYFHKGQMEYTYHGTDFKNLNNILKNGLKTPDGKNVKIANGSQYGLGIYTSKVPEYAQLYANPIFSEGKYYQLIFLIRQPLQDIDTQGQMDVYGEFTHALYSNQGPLSSYKNIHMLHQKLMTRNDIQFMTTKQKTVLIQAVLIKVHDVNPMNGQYLEINKMIKKLQDK